MQDSGAPVESVTVRKGISRKGNTTVDSKPSPPSDSEQENNSDERKKFVKVYVSDSTVIRLQQANADALKAQATAERLRVQALAAGEEAKAARAQARQDAEQVVAASKIAKASRAVARDKGEFVERLLAEYTVARKAKKDAAAAAAALLTATKEKTWLAVWQNVVETHPCGKVCSCDSTGSQCNSVAGTIGL